MQPSDNWQPHSVNAATNAPITVPSEPLTESKPAATSEVLGPSSAPVSSTQPIVDVPEAQESVLDAEWVSRAKEIAQKYSADPFTQSKEMSVLKAQFLKARYNKDVKVGED